VFQCWLHILRFHCFQPLLCHDFLLLLLLHSRDFTRAQSLRVLPQWEGTLRSLPTPRWHFLPPTHPRPPPPQMSAVRTELVGRRPPTPPPMLLSVRAPSTILTPTVAVVLSPTAPSSTVAVAVCSSATPSFG